MARRRARPRPLAATSSTRRQQLPPQPQHRAVALAFGPQHWLAPAGAAAEIDADAAPPSSVTYEALCYTAKLPWIIENCKGTLVGNGTAYYLRSASVDQKELVDIIETSVFS